MSQRQKWKLNNWSHKTRRFIGVLIALVALSGCAAGTPQVVPTARPTQAPTNTATPTATPDRAATPTASPSPIGQPTGGPSPTPLFGPTLTPVPGEATPTRVFNPNAPRIEFFQVAGSVEPGSTVTLLWSVRNADSAVIYQLNRDGDRDRLWNVEPAGRQAVQTNERDRGQLNFELVAGPPTQRVTQRLAVPLECTVQWFFQPPPEECADDPAVESFLIEQRFERGRMMFIQEENRVYALFNDGFEPAWISFEDRFDPGTDQVSDPNFDAALPPGFFQPVASLGFVWRGNDTVRNRLGLAIEPELTYEGVIQQATLFGGADSLYITSTDGSVLKVIGTGTSWEIITPD